MIFKKRPSWPCVLPAVAVLACGCGRTTELPGGTKGILLVQGMPVEEIQINVFRQGAASSLAFGISDYAGRFELRHPESLEAVWLEPGEYKITIESVGEYYLRWPSPYSNPAETPLQHTLSGREEEFRVEIPIAPMQDAAGF